MTRSPLYRIAPVLLVGMTISATGRAPSPNGTEGPGFALIRSIATEPGIISGTVLDGIGDINGDGHGDLIVGAAYANPGGVQRAGSALIYSGTDGSLLHRLDGETSGSYFGRSVNGPADLNGDGLPDIVVGVPGAYSGHGAIIAYSGADMTEIFSIGGGPLSFGFGFALADAPDADDDGVRELLVSRLAGTTGNPGFVDVRSGFDGHLIRSLGPVPDIGMMIALHGTSAGYFDGDEVEDWAVYFGTTTIEFCGEVGTRVYSGATGEVIFASPIEDDLCSLGEGEVLSAGDLNADGFDDVWVVSAAFSCGGSSARGGVRVYLGPSGSLHYEECGPSAFGSYGSSAAPVEDLDCDGIGELVVGAPWTSAPGPTHGGAIYLVRGSDGEHIAQEFGQSAEELLGEAIGNVGDVDGDGRADVAVLTFEQGQSSTIRLYRALGGLTRCHHAAIMQGPGFDRCDTPSVEDLQIWQESSPYRFVGIYYGGDNRACRTQLELEPADVKGREWVRQVTAMGWKILPIWAGPSPRCRGSDDPDRAYIELDPEAAHVQGGQQAQEAVDQARELGLVGEDGAGTVVYYDIEPFSPELNPLCAPAVDAFVEGWSSMMRALGNLPGVYGHAKNAAAWFTLAERPDAIWLARYYFQRFEFDEKDGKYHGVYEYDPLETVWDIEGVPNNYWASHQRVYQYTDTHTEIYGGIAWSICSSVADGPLAIGAENPLLDPAQAPSVLPATAAPPGLGSIVIDAMKRLSPTEGWVLAGGDLLWSHNGGEAWEDITPPEADDKVVLATEFVDPLHGWVMSALPSESYSTIELSLSRTSDGGQTWETSAFRTFDEVAFPQSVDLEFIDPDTGWAVVRLGSSSNSSDGLLFHTTNGGEDWTEVSAPGGNPVRFLTADHGWTLSGPGRHGLLETSDGGVSWTPVSLTLPPPFEPRNEIYGLPVFENENLGLLPVILSDSTGTQIWFYVTNDGGTSWFLDQGVEIDEQVSPSSVFPVEIVDTEHWVLPTTGSLSGLVGPVLDLAFASPEVGWATIGGGQCTEDSGSVTCTLLSGLYGTTDGGDSWQPVSLPTGLLYLPLVLR